MHNGVMVIVECSDSDNVIDITFSGNLIALANLPHHNVMKILQL